MKQLAILALAALWLAGCSSGSREAACEVFSPATIDQPGAGVDPYVEPGRADPAASVPQQRC